jgi:hypothetical protein
VLEAIVQHGGLMGSGCSHCLVADERWRWKKAVNS